jgi:hypothetical protein
MSRCCAKFLIQMHHRCFDFLNTSYDKLHAHQNGSTSSTRSGEWPHGAQLPRSGSARPFFITALVIERDELRGISFSCLSKSRLRAPIRLPDYPASWSAMLLPLSIAIITDISGQCHSLTPIAAHWNHSSYLNAGPITVHGKRNLRPSRFSQRCPT